MSDQIELHSEEMKALNKEFADLGRQIKDGDYTIETQSRGRRKDTHRGTLTSFTDETTLTVTIAPSPANAAATLKSMTFEFKHDLAGSIGCFGGHTEGTITEKFRLERKDGTIVTYGPEIRDWNDRGDANALLNQVRTLGGTKLALDEYHAREEARKKPAQSAPAPKPPKR